MIAQDDPEKYYQVGAQIEEIFPSNRNLDRQESNRIEAQQEQLQSAPSELDSSKQ